MQHSRPYAQPGSTAATSAILTRAAPRLVVVIASPVRLVREGLGASLRDRDGIAALHTVGLDRDWLATVAALLPDVVLADLHNASPNAVAPTLRAYYPAARLVAFALAEIADDVFACAAAGFHGYISREGGADELYRAVLDAAEGRMTCAPHIAAAMFGRLTDLLRPREHDAVLGVLTARENAILALADEGCSNKEIARRLTISAATVKNHMHNILQKLRVTRRTQATARLRSTR